MTNAQWFMLVGGLLLVMGLSSTVLKRLPITTAIMYLAVGVVVGPSVLNAVSLQPAQGVGAAGGADRGGGADLAVLGRGQDARALQPAALARAHSAGHGVDGADRGPGGGVRGGSAGPALGAGVLLGAIVAPTDPVLATDVQIRHPGDRDQLRFTLTCEAGMNDGSAFPFVMLGLGLLGLHDLGELGLRWVLVDVLWASAGAC